MRTRKKFKRAAEVALIETLAAAARVTPRRAGQAVYARVGALAARMFPRDRRRAEENLAIAFPDAPAPFRRALAAAMFKTLGRNIFEFLRLENASRETLLARVSRIEGMEHFAAAERQGRGVIVITGHIGCWEVMPAHFVALGHSASVIARRMKVARLNERLVSLRRSFGVETIDRDENPRRIFDVLKAGGILGVLIDQHTSVAGAWVPFFGRPAYTPTGVAKIALASGAPIVPMAAFLQRDGRHVIHVLPAIEAGRVERSQREQAVRDITEACSLAVEKLIRIDPKQWVWFHHRWREQPDNEDGVDAAYAAEG